MNPIYGTTDLADILGVKVETLRQWRKRYDHFPTPAGYINAGRNPYWDAAGLRAVIDWRERGGVRPYARGE